MEPLNKTKISKLYVSKCGITLTGAKSIASALLHNGSIKLLVILGNPLTVEGAHLILRSAVNNGICQVVLVDKEYENEEEAKKMITILKDRNKQQVQYVVNQYCLQPHLEKSGTQFLYKLQVTSLQNILFTNNCVFIKG